MRLIIILILTIISCSKRYTGSEDTVKSGQLKISTETFGGKASVELRGEWEFYWSRFYSSNDFKSANPPEPDTFIRIPGPWSGMILHGKKLPKEGFATLRLKVKKDSTLNTPLAFKINRWSNAFKLFINDQLITSVGKISKIKEQEKYDSRPHIASFVAPGDSFDLIIQISNFTGKRSACTYPMSLGFEHQLQNQRMTSIAGYYVTFGAIFFIGLCLILAFLTIKPTYKALLYLGLACITISMRSLFMGESIVNDLFPNLPVALKFKIELSLLYSFVIFVNMYGRVLFPDDLKLWFIRIIWISHTVLILIVLLFNYDIALGATQIPHHIVTAFSGSYVLVVLCRALEIQKRIATIFMISLFVFFLAAINDILVFHHIYGSTYILHFGFLVFIIIQTFLVTYLYSRSHSRISVLKRNLALTNKELSLLKAENQTVSEDSVEKFCEFHKISSREKEVLQQILSGNSNNKIAENLFISFHTVRRHLYNIYKKSGISERNEFLSAIKNFSSEDDSSAKLLEKTEDQTSL